MATQTSQVSSFLVFIRGKGLHLRKRAFAYRLRNPVYAVKFLFSALRIKKLKSEQLIGILILQSNRGERITTQLSCVGSGFARVVLRKLEQEPKKKKKEEKRKKSAKGEGGSKRQEKRGFLFTPPSPGLFFALVPAFSKNWFGNAGYVRYYGMKN